MIVLEDFLPNYWFKMSDNFGLGYFNYMHLVYNFKVNTPGWMIEIDIAELQVRFIATAKKLPNLALMKGCQLIEHEFDSINTGMRR